MERRNVVHLAGPAYSPEEAEGMAAIAALLEANGFEVYLKSRDGLGPVLSPDASTDGDPGHELRYRSVLESASFALEIYQLVHRCDCMVFNMNGRVPDDGGAFLAAVAFTVGRPVVLYKRDHRTELYGNNNAMIPGLSFDFSTVAEPARLPGEVTKAIARCAESHRGVAPLPPLVKLNTDLGREVWESLQRFKAQGSSATPTELYDQLAAACEASETRLMGCLI